MDEYITSLCKNALGYMTFRSIVFSLPVFFLIIYLLFQATINSRVHTEAMYTTAATPTPIPNVTLFGQMGTFGQLASMSALPTGQSFSTVAVTNWGLSPGESEFFATLDAQDDVVLGTNPQTDNESYPTADQMNIGVFTSNTNTFRTIVIPTSSGSAAATNPFSSVGGASVDGITPITINNVPRIAFISAVPYSGWDVQKYGEYPSLGYLDLTTGSLQYNQSISLTADQIHNKSTLGTSACPMATNIFNQQVASCRGLAEMGLLPLSQRLVITQYFPDSNNGQASGRIIVMNTNGSIAASYTYPNIPNGSGGYLSINPREVDVDPTSRGALEYFSVIFDVTNNGLQANFPLQEFAYNRSTNKIIPVSRPILSGQTNNSGQYYRFETARYDTLGNLWATQAITNTLGGGPIVVYTKSSGYRKLETTCKAPSNWNGASWDASCSPDRTAVGTDTYGQSRSFTEDPKTHTMYAATLSGYLLRVKQSGSGTKLTITPLTAINLGLDQLVNRSTHYIGFRKGVIDPKARVLWLPVVQIMTPASCPTWPGSTPCAAQTLPQWLYRFDLNALSS